MRLFSFTVLILVGILSGFLSPAHADYFVWQDSRSGASLSWPDTWKRVNNADPDDIITIMAPSGRGHAACRLRARKDVRYTVYPPGYAASVQKVAYNYAFWDSYLAEYNDPEILDIRDGAGLGRGFAGFVIADYESAVQGPMTSRRAMIFAASYFDKLYILECSAHEDAFPRWKKMFLSIAGSVDFKKTHHQIRSGHYPYNFMLDPRIQFEGTEGPQRIIY